MDNMLSVLENYMLDNPDDIARGIADDFLAVGIKAKIPPARCRELSPISPLQSPCPSRNWCRGRCL